MDHSELLRMLARTFDTLGVRYFVTGSVASMTYSEVRMTNDIDVVAELQFSHVRPLCQAFPPPDFYLSEEAVRDAIATRFQFNILYPDMGLKIDVIVPPDTPFNRLRLARVRRLPSFPDQQVAYASAEDVILMKLSFYQEGQSEKHLRDISSVLRISGHRLDYGYLSEWAAKFDVQDTWQRLLREARPGPN